MPKYTLDRELENVLSRAKDLYPRLVARRAEIAAELASVEAALAHLDKLSGSVGSAPARPSPRVGSKKGPSKLTPKKLEEPVLDVLQRCSGPVGSARITEVLHAEGIPVGIYQLQMALKRLRDRGRVRASGVPKRFVYELAGRR